MSEPQRNTAITARLHGVVLNGVSVRSFEITGTRLTVGHDVCNALHLPTQSMAGVFSGHIITVHREGSPDHVLGLWEHFAPSVDEVVLLTEDGVEALICIASETPPASSTPAVSSPFDAIRQVRADGTDFWSARDLMPLLGYSKWQDFANAIDRSRASCANSNHHPDREFVQVTQIMDAHNLGPQRKADFELSRYACYLIAMNGDPRKEKVAAAQHYFVIKTREAEVATQPSFSIPATYADALRAAADQAERAERAEQQAKELESRIEQDAPMVAKAEAHTRADNAAVNRQTFAREVQAWGKRNDIKILHEHVYHLLRERGMVVSGHRSDRNQATAHAVKSGWAWTHKETTPMGHVTAVTYLYAAGQDIAWRWVLDQVNTYGDLAPRGRNLPSPRGFTR